MRTVIATAIVLALGAAPAARAAKPLADKVAQPAKPEAAKPPAKAAKVNWTEKARKGESLYATFETSMGPIVVQLLSKEAPKTVENFVSLAAGEKEWTDPMTQQKTHRPLYDGTIFHRVIPSFMIQGGDPLGRGVGGPGYSFADEFKSGRAFDKPCLLAMANSGPNTNGSQFFITEVPTPHLTNRHTIFGEGIKGCDLVAKITRVPVVEGNRPVKAITLDRVVLSDKAP